MQLELSFFQYTHDSYNDNAQTIDTWSILADTNLKLGVTNAMDLQFIFTPYTDERTDPDVGSSFTSDSGSSR